MLKGYVYSYSYEVAGTVISAAKNVEKQFKINKRSLATGRLERHHAEELLLSTAQYLSNWKKVIF